MSVTELNKTRKSLARRGLYVDLLDILKLRDDIPQNFQFLSSFETDLEYVKYYASIFNSKVIVNEADNLTKEQAAELRDEMEQKLKKHFKKSRSVQIDGVV